MRPIGTGRRDGRGCGGIELRRGSGLQPDSIDEAIVDQKIADRNRPQLWIRGSVSLHQDLQPCGKRLSGGLASDFFESPGLTSQPRVLDMVESWRHSAIAIVSPGRVSKGVHSVGIT